MASEGVLATLHAAWRALFPLDLPMAVIGGLALSAWNHARFTRDADVLISIGPSRLDEAINALRASAFHPKHDPPCLSIDGQTIVQFTHQPASALLPFQFDLLVANAGFQGEAVDRGDIDVSRLSVQARDLGLDAELATVWREAFPDEASP